MSRKHFDKYAFYEKSVQAPDSDVEQFQEIFTEIFGKAGRILREDFCGTFQVCCEWVKAHAKNQAIGLDLDPEPLEYGAKNHLPKLSSSQRDRVRIFQKNVLAPMNTRSDLTVACNFSYQIFKTRKELVKYFRSSYKALADQGILFLDLAGGPGMIKKTKDKTPVRGRGGKLLFTYVWDQKSFDPVTHFARYAIHFQMPDRSWKKDVFTYDWRLWTIPELKEALLDAGFDDVAIYWEKEENGKGTGEYIRTETGSNDHAWIAYIVGIKRGKIGPLRRDGSIGTARND